jgi:hypothetical protein
LNGQCDASKNEVEFFKLRSGIVQGHSCNLSNPS